jgi:hypothetical protein
MDKLIAWVLLLMVGAFGDVRAGAAPEIFRNIRVHVVDSHGHFAPQRKIRLVGLERWSLVSSEDKAAPFWNFVTDNKGNCVVPIGDFAGWEANEVRPGWGVYALVVESGKEDAGGVSSRFWFDNAPTHHYDPANMKWAPEWGAILPVPAAGLDLTIMLLRGFTLKGRVVDDQHPEKPLSGVEVRTANDLHADTHTGFGGQILGGYAKTDALGNFVIPHQFPQALRLDIEPTIWLKTRIDGKWEDQVKTVVDPPAKGDVVNVEIGATREARFKYFGRVLDAENRPVANVSVTLGVSSNPDSALETWFDEHDSLQTSTKRDGSYEIVSPTPWGRWLSATMPDQSRLQYQLPEMLPPGKYDLDPTMK